MAVVTIPDDVLREAGLSEGELLVEMACRLYDAGKLTLRSAARMAGLNRGDLEDALLDRGISIYRPTLRDFADDLAGLDRLGV